MDTMTPAAPVTVPMAVYDSQVAHDAVAGYDAASAPVVATMTPA